MACWVIPAAFRAACRLFLKGFPSSTLPGAFVQNLFEFFASGGAHRALARQAKRNSSLWVRPTGVWGCKRGSAGFPGPARWRYIRTVSHLERSPLFPALVGVATLTRALFTVWDISHRPDLGQLQRLGHVCGKVPLPPIDQHGFNPL